LTVNRAAIRQTGDTCLTTKTTLAGRGRVKVRVVKRRRFGPVVPIQPREDLRAATLV
jgi:hypothetical protein